MQQQESNRKSTNETRAEQTVGAEDNYCTNMWCMEVHENTTIRFNPLTIAIIRSTIVQISRIVKCFLCFLPLVRVLKKSPRQNSDKGFFSSSWSHFPPQNSHVQSLLDVKFRGHILQIVHILQDSFLLASWYALCSEGYIWFTVLTQHCQ